MGSIPVCSDIVRQNYQRNSLRKSCLFRVLCWTNWIFVCKKYHFYLIHIWKVKSIDFRLRLPCLLLLPNYDLVKLSLEILNEWKLSLSKTDRERREHSEEAGMISELSLWIHKPILFIVITYKNLKRKFLHELASV